MGHREPSTIRHGRTPAGAGPAPRQIIRFCVVFLVCVVAARVALDEPAMSESLREPYCRHIASVCGSALRALGIEAEVVGQVYLGAGAFGVKIAPACDGLNAMSILAAAILAFPATWTARGVGVLLGLSLLVLINVVRIVGLFLIGLVSYRTYEIVHVYVFQVFLIAVAVGCFLVWARSVSTGRLARRTVGDEVRA